MRTPVHWHATFYAAFLAEAVHSFSQKKLKVSKNLTQILKIRERSPLHLKIRNSTITFYAIISIMRL